MKGPQEFLLLYSFPLPCTQVSLREGEFRHATTDPGLLPACRDESRCSGKAEGSAQGPRGREEILLEA